MTHTTEVFSPLRQRMIDDMTMRRLSPKTQTAYIRSVKKLAQFLGHSPHTASAEDLAILPQKITVTPAQGNGRTTLSMLGQWFCTSAIALPALLISV